VDGLEDDEEGEDSLNFLLFRERWRSGNALGPIQAEGRTAMPWHPDDACDGGKGSRV